jgi:hypothetical protein
MSAPDDSHTTYVIQCGRLAELAPDGTFLMWLSSPGVLDVSHLWGLAATRDRDVVFGGLSGSGRGGGRLTCTQEGTQADLALLQL